MKKMSKAVISKAVCNLVLVVSMGSLASCATPGKDTAIGAGGGAAVGAGAGALIGGGKGALIGAGAGALVGGAIGNYLDKQAQQLKKVAETHRTADGILVNLKNDLLFDTGSADQTAKLWDVATGREIRTFAGHADQIKCIALSHDGTRLATASYDLTIRLWDVATGQELIALKGHTDFVVFVAFSADDKILTSGSRDQTIRFWRAATAEEVAAQDNK